MKNNTTVTVDLQGIGITLEVKDAKGMTHVFNLDVPNAYRLGNSLIEAAVRLADYCIYSGLDADEGHRLPADAIGSVPGNVIYLPAPNP